MKKKWFFIILIVVVLAVVLAIVFINLFTKKDTKALAENVYSVTQSGYLDEDNEKNDQIEKYLEKLLELSSRGNSTLADNKESFANYVSTFEGFEIMGEFFNRHIVFIDYTDTYKANRKGIQDDFAGAQKAVDNLAKYLTKNESVINVNEELIERTWHDCGLDVENLFKCTTSAFKRLTEVYTASMPSTIMNNDFSKIVFEEVNQMMSDVVEKKAGKGGVLENFVEAYLSENGEEILLSYSYNIDLKNKTKSIKENGKESSWYENFVGGIIVVL